MTQPAGYPLGPGQGQWAVAPPAYLVRDQRHNTAAIVIAWIAVLFTFAYMLPWAIAATRGKANHGAVAVINLLLGWTFIGWVVALVMACTAHQAGVAAYPVALLPPQQPALGSPPRSLAAPAAWYPSPDGLGKRYWDGQVWTEHVAP